MSTDIPTFAAVEAEYAAARAAAEAAEARLKEAGQAMRARRCDVHYATGPNSRPGYVTNFHCTLERDHAGDHGKSAA